MKSTEIDELRSDILDAFMDLGTESTQYIIQKNIDWYSWKDSSYDDLFKQDTEKEFNGPYSIIGLCLGQAPKTELDELGLDYDKYEKVYITADQFIDYTVIPKEGDRYIHRGVKYDIIRMKELVLADSHIVFYTVYAKEATFIAQTETYKQTEDIYFEPDKSQESISTTVVDPRSDLFLEFSAEIKSDKLGPFDIIAGVNDAFAMGINGANPILFNIAEANYTVDDIIIELQSLFDTNYGVGIFLVFKDVDVFGFKLVEYGLDKGFEIVNTSAFCYDILGLDIGLYLGHKELA